MQLLAPANTCQQPSHEPTADGLCSCMLLPCLPLHIGTAPLFKCPCLPSPSSPAIPTQMAHHPVLSLLLLRCARAYLPHPWLPGSGRSPMLHLHHPPPPPVPPCSLLASGSLAAWGGITPWDHDDYGDIPELPEEPSSKPPPSPLLLCTSCKEGCPTTGTRVCCGGTTYTNECVASCCALPEADCYEGACSSP